MAKSGVLGLVLFAVLAACGSKDNEKKIYVSDPQLEQQLIDAQAEIERLEKDLADKDQAFEEASNNLEILRSSVDSLTDEVARLEHEEETLLRLMLNAGDAKDLEKTKERLITTQRFLEAARQSLKDAESKLANLDADYQETKRQLELAETQRNGMQTMAEQQISLILSTTHELLVFMEARGISSYQEATDMIAAELENLQGEGGSIQQWETEVKVIQQERLNSLRAVQDQQLVIALLNRDLKEFMAQASESLDEELLEAYAAYHRELLVVERLEQRLATVTSELNAGLAAKDQLEVALSELESEYTSLAANKSKAMIGGEEGEILQEKLQAIHDEIMQRQAELDDMKEKVQKLLSSEAQLQELKRIRDELLLAKAEVLETLQGTRIASAISLRDSLLAEFQKQTREWKEIQAALTDGKVKVVQYELFLQILRLFKSSAGSASDEQESLADD